MKDVQTNTGDSSVHECMAYLAHCGSMGVNGYNGSLNKAIRRQAALHLLCVRWPPNEERHSLPVTGDIILKKHASKSLIERLMI